MDVAEWLRSLGLEDYEPAFRENHIGSDLLPSLTAEDLKELGVASVGHRRRLLSAAAALRGETAGAVTAPATPAREAPPPAGAERRHLTVMFCDLVGSTALSERFDPEDLRHLIRSYHACVERAVTRAGGYLAKFMGDGVLVYFGYPEAHEDDAERAVRTGLGIVDLVGRLAQPERLQVRVGIATGLVVVGDLIGAGVAQEHGVVGETPNLAARLQGLADPDTIVIAESTRRQTGALFEMHALGPQRLKGFAAPQPAWRVVGERPFVGRFEALRSEQTPLVGREEELDTLMRRWAMAEAGEGRAVLVSAEPGVGKSRLSATFRQRLQESGERAVRLDCSPHHQDSALFPIVGHLTSAAGIERPDPPDTRLEKLGALLATRLADEDDVMILADLLSLPVPAHSPVTRLSPQRRKERTLAAILELLTARSRERPLLILFEDLQWIDPTSRELLDMLVERLPALPILLIATFRPEFQPPWIGQPHVTSLALTRLARPEAAALVRQLAGERRLSPAVVDEIVTRSDGVPLFLEELTKAVVESMRDDPTPAGDIPPEISAGAAGRIPATLYASLMARLDRLGPETKRVAQIGAALGREFSYEILSQIVQREETALLPALDRLVGAGLLFQRGVPPQASFLFKHALVQEAAYRTLLRGARRELHARIGATLEERYPELVETQPELIAHHFASGEDAAKAVLYWMQAGQHAVARSAMAEAAAHLGKALELLDRLPDGAERRQRELTLRIALGNALIAAKGYTAPGTRAVYERARALCEQLGDTPRLVQVVNGLWSFHLMRGDIDAAMAVAQDLLRRAGEGGAAELRLAAHRLVGTSLLQLGELAAACAELDAADAVLTELGGKDGAADVVGGKDALVGVPAYLSIVLCLLGRYAEARALSAAALDEARRSYRPHRFAFALGVAGCWFHAMLGETRPDLEDAFARISADQDFPFWTAFAIGFRGLAAARAGQVREGVATVRDAVSRHKAMGALWSVPFFYGSAAPFAAADEGLELVDEGLRQAGESRVCWFVPELHRIRGELLLARGDAAGGEECLHAAVADARRQESRHWELRAVLSLADLHEARRDRRAALDLLDPVYRAFHEPAATADLRRAQEMIRRLA